MIMKELKVPISVLQRMALLRLLPYQHTVRKDVVSDLKRFLKGYYGERDCCYYLSLLPEDKYYIFHGLRLKDKNEFQMDLLILSKTFILIAEVKNIAQKLIFKKGSDQVIQEYDGVQTGISNPISQVKRQRYQFKNWLRKMKIKQLPIEHLVIISKISTIIETTPDNMQIFNHLIYAENLLDKILELEKKYPEPQVNQKYVTSLSETLLKEDIQTIPDILHTYKISKSELITRLLCPCCKNSPMNYISAKWMCVNCKYTSKTAHLRLLDDYFYVISPTITRKQFNDYLQIRNGKYLLSTLNLPSIGTKRGTKYYRPPGCILSQDDSNAIEKGEYVIP